MPSANSFGIIVEARGEGQGKIARIAKMVIAGIGKRDDERSIQPRNTTRLISKGRRRGMGRGIAVIAVNRRDREYENKPARTIGVTSVIVEKALFWLDLG